MQKASAADERLSPQTKRTGEAREAASVADERRWRRTTDVVPEVVCVADELHCCQTARHDAVPEVAEAVGKDRTLAQGDTRTRMNSSLVGVNTLVNTIAPSHPPRNTHVTCKNRHAERQLIPL